MRQRSGVIETTLRCRGTLCLITLKKRTVSREVLTREKFTREMPVPLTPNEPPREERRWCKAGNGPLRVAVLYCTFPAQAWRQTVSEHMRVQLLPVRAISGRRQPSHDLHIGNNRLVVCYCQSRPPQETDIGTCAFCFPADINDVTNDCCKSSPAMRVWSVFVFLSSNGQRWCNLE